jgi:hypothetical protein
VCDIIGHSTKEARDEARKVLGETDCQDPEEGDIGMEIVDLCRTYSISDATYYNRQA